MSKKCAHCGAPIEGFWAKVSALAGVKKSDKNPDYCNKCEGAIPVAVAERQNVGPVESQESTPVENVTSEQTDSSEKQ